jgi:antitoxin component YwqK of YwqJK toxin-antitoxin module
VIYWDNGQLYAKGTMKDGKDHGSFERYCKNGQFDSKGPYKDGNQHSPWVSYNRDGSVDAKGTGTFKDGMKVK